MYALPDLYYPQPTDGTVQQELDTVRQRRLSSIAASINNGSQIPDW